MTTEEQLKADLDKASEAHFKALNSAPADMDFHQFEAYMARTGDKVDRLSRQYRMIKTPKMRELQGRGDHMALQDFIDCVEGGGFIDYDGSGNYATATEESNISIYPSDVESGMVRKDFTHVVWYNR